MMFVCVSACAGAKRRKCGHVQWVSVRRRRRRRWRMGSAGDGHRASGQRHAWLIVNKILAKEWNRRWLQDFYLQGKVLDALMKEIERSHPNSALA